MQKLIANLAQTHRNELVVCWDNFDYNQGVRHQTLDEPSKHVSATTGKLCIGRSIPAGGLQRSMLHLDVKLTSLDIWNANGNKEDEILYNCQRYWIAEAIRYTHRTAVESVFDRDNSMLWPELPSVKRLPVHQTRNYTLSPILENEGTISGTYKVIDEIFTGQLNLDREKEFDGPLRLVFGDQKTVSLVRTVQKERQEAGHPYDQYKWLLPIPGLFHWRTNYMDMIHDTYSGSESAATESTLYHNKNILGCIQGHKSPFHHKEEVATRAFDARVTACFYRSLPAQVRPADYSQVDNYIHKLSCATFMEKVNEIREYIFLAKEQSDPVDEEFLAHARFLQQMETYKTLKLAIKLGDVGLIKRVLARCCLLFHGSGQSKYAFLSLYMTWLTQTGAADKVLQDAILANGLVNLRGAKDSHFEMDRLNELLNLEFRTLVALRRASTMEISELFRRAALTASYCTGLKVDFEATFGEYSNGRHQVKDASTEVRNLAFQIWSSDSIIKQPHGRSSPFKPRDILQKGVAKLNVGVDKFNKSVVEGRWEEDQDLANATSTPIAVLDDIVNLDDDDIG
jgi:hypothetical protein